MKKKLFRRIIAGVTIAEIVFQPLFPAAGLIIASLAAAPPVRAQQVKKCDGWADPGSEHRNSGNGCFYRCQDDGAWSAPLRCDGQGNGQFQGEAAKNEDERRIQEAEVARRAQEAAQQLVQQTAAETQRIAAETVRQRALEEEKQKQMAAEQLAAARAEAERIRQQDAGKAKALEEEAKKRAAEAAADIEKVTPELAKEPSLAQTGLAPTAVVTPPPNIPGLAGDKAWGDCKLAAGSDADCTKKAQEAYVKTEGGEIAKEFAAGGTAETYYQKNSDRKRQDAVNGQIAQEVLKQLEDQGRSTNQLNQEEYDRVQKVIKLSLPQADALNTVLETDNSEIQKLVKAGISGQATAETSALVREILSTTGAVKVSPTAAAASSDDPKGTGCGPQNFGKETFDENRIKYICTAAASWQKCEKKDSDWTCPVVESVTAAGEVVFAGNVGDGCSADGLKVLKGGIALQDCSVKKMVCGLDSAGRTTCLDPKRLNLDTNLQESGTEEYRFNTQNHSIETRIPDGSWEVVKTCEPTQIGASYGGYWSCRDTKLTQLEIERTGNPCIGYPDGTPVKVDFDSNTKKDICLTCTSGRLGGTPSDCPSLQGGGTEPRLKPQPTTPAGGGNASNIFVKQPTPEPTRTENIPGGTASYECQGNALIKTEKRAAVIGSRYGSIVPPIVTSQVCEWGCEAAACRVPGPDEIAAKRYSIWKNAVEMAQLACQKQGRTNCSFAAVIEAPKYVNPDELSPAIKQVFNDSAWVPDAVRQQLIDQRVAELNAKYATGSRGSGRSQAIRISPDTIRAEAESFVNDMLASGALRPETTDTLTPDSPEWKAFVQNAQDHPSLFQTLIGGRYGGEADVADLQMQFYSLFLTGGEVMGNTFGAQNLPYFQAQKVKEEVIVWCGLKGWENTLTPEQEVCLRGESFAAKANISHLQEEREKNAALQIASGVVAVVSGGVGGAAFKAAPKLIQFAAETIPQIVSDTAFAPIFADLYIGDDRRRAETLELLAQTAPAGSDEAEIWSRQAAAAGEQAENQYQQELFNGFVMAGVSNLAFGGIAPAGKAVFGDSPVGKLLFGEAAGAEFKAAARETAEAMNASAALSDVGHRVTTAEEVEVLAVQARQDLTRPENVLGQKAVVVSQDAAVPAGAEVALLVENYPIRPESGSLFDRAADLASRPQEAIGEAVGAAVGGVGRAVDDVTDGIRVGIGCRIAMNLIPQAYAAGPGGCVTIRPGQTDAPELGEGVKIDVDPASQSVTIRFPGAKPIAVGEGSLINLPSDKSFKVLAVNSDGGVVLKPVTPDLPPPTSVVSEIDGILAPREPQKIDIKPVDQFPTFNLANDNLDNLIDEEFRGSTVRVYGSVLEINGRETPVAIKLYRTDMPWKPEEVLKEELIGAQVLANLGIGPRVFGIASAPDGRIGFIMDKVAGQDIYFAPASWLTGQTVADLRNAEKLLFESGYIIENVEAYVTPQGRAIVIDPDGVIKVDERIPIVASNENLSIDEVVRRTDFFIRDQGGFGSELEGMARNIEDKIIVRERIQELIDNNGTRDQAVEIGQNFADLSDGKYVNTKYGEEAGDIYDELKSVGSAQPLGIVVPGLKKGEVFGPKGPLDFDWKGFRNEDTGGLQFPIGRTKPPEVEAPVKLGRQTPEVFQQAGRVDIYEPRQPVRSIDLDPAHPQALDDLPAGATVDNVDGLGYVKNPDGSWTPLGAETGGGGEGGQSVYGQTNYYKHGDAIVGEDGTKVSLSPKETGYGNTIGLGPVENDILIVNGQRVTELVTVGPNDDIHINGQKFKIVEIEASPFTKVIDRKVRFTKEISDSNRFYTADGKVIEVDPESQLGALGGAGGAYRARDVSCGGPDCIAKIIDPNGTLLYGATNIDVDKYTRLEFEVLQQRYNASGSGKIENPGHIYPKPGELIFDANGKVAGYTMEEIHGVTLDRYKGPPLPKELVDDLIGRLTFLNKNSLPHGDIKLNNIIIETKPASGLFGLLKGEEPVGIRVIDPYPVGLEGTEGELFTLRIGDNLATGEINEGGVIPVKGPSVIEKVRDSTGRVLDNALGPIRRTIEPIDKIRANIDPDKADFSIRNNGVARVYESGLLVGDLPRGAHSYGDVVVKTDEVGMKIGIYNMYEDDMVTRNGVRLKSSEMGYSIDLEGYVELIDVRPGEVFTIRNVEYRVTGGEKGRLVIEARPIGGQKFPEVRTGIGGWMENIRDLLSGQPKLSEVEAPVKLGRQTPEVFQQAGKVDIYEPRQPVRSVDFDPASPKALDDLPAGATVDNVDGLGYVKNPDGSWTPLGAEKGGGGEGIIPAEVAGQGGLGGIGGTVRKAVGEAGEKIGEAVSGVREKILPSKLVVSEPEWNTKTVSMDGFQAEVDVLVKQAKEQGMSPGTRITISYLGDDLKFKKVQTRLKDLATKIKDVAAKHSDSSLFLDFGNSDILLGSISNLSDPQNMVWNVRNIPTKAELSYLITQSADFRNKAALARDLGLVSATVAVVFGGADAGLHYYFQPKTDKVPLKDPDAASRDMRNLPPNDFRCVGNQIVETSSTTGEILRKLEICQNGCNSGMCQAKEGAACKPGEHLKVSDSSESCSLSCVDGVYARDFAQCDSIDFSGISTNKYREVVMRTLNILPDDFFPIKKFDKLSIYEVPLDNFSLNDIGDFSPEISWAKYKTIDLDGVASLSGKHLLIGRNALSEGLDRNGISSILIHELLHLYALQSTKPLPEGVPYSYIASIPAAFVGTGTPFDYQLVTGCLVGGADSAFHNKPVDERAVNCTEDFAYAGTQYVFEACLLKNYSPERYEYFKSEVFREKEYIPEGGCNQKSGGLFKENEIQQQDNHRQTESKSIGIPPVFAAEKGGTRVVPLGIYRGLAGRILLKKSLEQLPEDQLTAEKVAENLVIAGRAAANLPQRGQFVSTGNGIIGVTGTSGVIAGGVRKGVYKVSVVPIPGFDLIVPAKIDPGGRDFSALTIGIVPGRGRVKIAGQINLWQKVWLEMGKWVTRIIAPEVGAAENNLPTIVPLTVQLFRDENKNGVFDPGEAPVEWAGVKVNLESAAKTKNVNFQLAEGWNLIAFPVIPDSVTKASELVKDVALNGGYVTTVSAWDGNRWVEYSQRGGEAFGNDFKLEPGRAYFVRSHADSAWAVSGAPLDDQTLTISLKKGWNGVGIPQANTTAVQVMDEIQGTGNREQRIVNSEQIGETADQVGRWDYGLWDMVIKRRYSSEHHEIYGRDFPIKDTEGYFVHLNEDASWTK